MGKLFGTDGIRGEANVWPMTPELALKLGRALAARLRERAPAGHRPRVVVGKDTRLSGYIFEQAIAAGVCSMGADIWLCGPLPTPGIANITTSMRADAGIVVSASHNPYYDNGIKLFGGDGFKLADAEEDALEAVLLGNDDRLEKVGSTRASLGRAKRIEEAWARYVVFLKAVLPTHLRLDGVRIVVDCGHGAAYRVAPAVFEELGATVITMGTAPDGTNINAGCGALYPEHMCEEVRRTGASIGIALDGDADRVIVADEHGEVVDGDRILAVTGIHMKRTGVLKNDTVVATVMSNLGLDVALRREGIRLERAQVGDRHVVENMRNNGHNLGGEQSGHIVFLDHTSTGDGVVAALKMLTVMLSTGRPLSELASVVTPVPQVMVNVPVARKVPLESLPRVSALIAAVERALGEDGRVLVRYSGTESKARVMIEGLDRASIQRQADDIATVLREEIGP